MTTYIVPNPPDLPGRETPDEEDLIPLTPDRELQPSFIYAPTKKSPDAQKMRNNAYSACTIILARAV